MDGLPLEVDTKIANALLGLATEAFVAAQLASRDAGITALQASKADAALLASYATNAALSASETALQSALDAILAELAALQLSGRGIAFLWRKTVQNELFFQAVYEYTPCKNSISWVLYVLYGRQPAEPPLSPGSMLYVLYVLYLTRQPTEHPLSPGSLLYVLYVLYLTRQPTEHPLSPSSLLYVLYVLYVLYARNLYYMCYIGAI